MKYLLLFFCALTLSYAQVAEALNGIVTLETEMNAINGEQNKGVNVNIELSKNDFIEARHSVFLIKQRNHLIVNEYHIKGAKQ